MATLKVEIPEKLQFLFTPYRYKAARGGRGSAKSWSFARALLIQGMIEPLRILCAREIQNSIKDSVHKLLKDQITALGIERYYEIQEQVIKGKNGTEFLFTGLSVHTVSSIKSFEGVDRAWVEEGQTVSKRSWDILLPTIRKEGSEIWVSYNPDLDTDPTHQLFAVNPPDGCKSVEINWSDNPWWNDIMEEMRLRCLREDPDNYDNIWEGKCRPAVEGAIYFKEIQRAEANGQICAIPYDPMLKVHVVIDLGWNDNMAIALVQRHQSSIRVIDYIQDSHRTLDSYSAELKAKNLNWGKIWLPHDGFSGDVKTGKTCEGIFKALGWKVASRDEIVELPLEGGIKNARMSFPRVYFDKAKTEKLVECLRRYRRKRNQTTGEESSPVHDENSHGGDCFRYICANADQMRNDDDERRRPAFDCYTPLDSVVGY